MDSNERRKYQEEKLSEAGWTVECWSPFEIRTKDGSFATGEAAIIVLQSIMSEHETEEDLIETLVERGFPNGHKLDGDPTNGLLFVGIADMLYDELAYVREMNVEMFEVIAKLAKIRCLKKAPKDTPQIQWPTGVSKDIEEESNLRREQLSKFDRIQQADVISNHYSKNASISRDLYQLLEFRKKAPQNEEVDSLILSISDMLILSHRKDFGKKLIDDEIKD